MSAIGWLQILLYALVLLALTKPLGIYMFRVFEGDQQPMPRFFGPIERVLYRLCGVDPKKQQTWTEYTLALLLFSAITMLVTYAIERLQQVLPLNPQQLGPVPSDLAFNTAASFTTNTNWQSYGGESTMSYLTQMAGLAWHNYISAAAGIGVMLAIARGLTYHLRPGVTRTLGNFWVDLIRATVYVLMPICIPLALVLVSQGVLQNFSPYVELTTLEGAKQTLAMGPTASQIAIKQLGTNGGGFFNVNSSHPFEGGTPLANFWVDLIRATVYVLMPICIPLALVLVSQGVLQNFSPYVELTTLEGAKQTLAMGPTASQIAIKQLGTNGGGFFNVNSSHPFEGGTPLANFLQMLAILVIPAAQTYTYGRMARDQKQGWVLFTAMAVFFLVGVSVAYHYEAAGNPALQSLAVDQTAGNMEGKEVRYGIAGSVTWAVATTDASNGSVNSMHDSYTPLGGLVPLVNIQLGEVVFGGVGAGLYGMLIFVLLAVFIAGLMVGRTPEYLGKKIESREVKLAMLYVLIFPLFILYFTAWSAVVPYGVSSLNNNGPHGLTEILYAFSSAAGNNGSAFAGLTTNTLWYNVTQGLTMLACRFLMIVPVLAIAGSMVGKKVVPAGPGTFPTDGTLFIVLLVGVIFIVGALTFFPVLSLGPIVEHFVAQGGKVF